MNACPYMTVHNSHTRWASMGIVWNEWLSKGLQFVFRQRVAMPLGNMQQSFECKICLAVHSVSMPIRATFCVHRCCWGAIE